MVDSQELDAILASAVYKPVAADDNFADVVKSQFRNHAARLWEVRQAVSGAKNPIGKRGRQLWGVSGYKQANGLEIIDRLWRPPYSSHFAIRCRTSS